MLLSQFPFSIPIIYARLDSFSVPLEGRKDIWSGRKRASSPRNCEESFMLILSPRIKNCSVSLHPSQQPLSGLSSHPSLSLSRSFAKQISDHSSKSWRWSIRHVSHSVVLQRRTAEHQAEANECNKSDNNFIEKDLPRRNRTINRRNLI